MMQLTKINKHPDLPLYSKFNLSFSYCNRKYSSSKDAKRKISLNKKHSQQSLHHDERISRNVSSSIPVNQIFRFESASLPPKRKSFEANFAKKTQKQMCEMEHIGSGFPPRKKKSQAHQLFKLLLKFSHDLSQGLNQQKTKSKLSFPSTNESMAKISIVNRFKAKPKLNWVKNRYCANRDKEKGLIPFSVGFSHFSRASSLEVMSTSQY